MTTIVRTLGPLVVVPRVLAGLVVLLALGCSAEPRTEVLVVIDAEPAVRAMASHLELRVLGASRSAEDWREVRVQTIGSPVVWPRSIGLVPSDGDARRRFDVRASARQGADGPVVAHVRVLSSYLAGQTLELRLLLEDACIGQTCGDEQTCRAGSCVEPEVVDPRTLGPPGRLRVDGGTAGDGGSMLDAGDGRDAGDGCRPLSDAGATTPVDASSALYQPCPPGPGADFDGDGLRDDCGYSVAGVVGTLDIPNTTGLVIARDGTIYYSRNGSIGRLLPDGTRNDDWVGGVGASQSMGLDAANVMLYAAEVGEGTIFVIDTTAVSPRARGFVTGTIGIHGLTLGPDGALYFSTVADWHVYRVALGGSMGTPVQLTASPIPSAGGLAFMDDGSLLVGSGGARLGGAGIFRLTLGADGRETARSTFVSNFRCEQISVDAEGGVWATGSGPLIYRAPDGAISRMLPGYGRLDAIEFGAGTLGCHDLYITSDDAILRLEALPIPGRRVPWH